MQVERLPLRGTSPRECLPRARQAVDWGNGATRDARCERGDANGGVEHARRAQGAQEAECVPEDALCEARVDQNGVSQPGGDLLGQVEGQAVEPLEGGLAPGEELVREVAVEDDARVRPEQAEEGDGGGNLRRTRHARRAGVHGCHRTAPDRRSTRPRGAAQGRPPGRGRDCGWWRRGCGRGRRRAAAGSRRARKPAAFRPWSPGTHGPFRGARCTSPRGGPAGGAE